MFLRNSGLVVILLVNLIFVLKYGVRQEFLPLYVLVILYSFLFAGGVAIINKFKEKIDQYARFNTVFLGLILLVLISLSILN